MTLLGAVGICHDVDSPRGQKKIIRPPFYRAETPPTLHVLIVFPRNDEPQSSNRIRV